MDNFRPIPILPIMSKILEKAVQQQLSDYLENTNLISFISVTFVLYAISYIAYLTDTECEEIWITDLLQVLMIFVDS